VTLYGVSQHEGKIRSAHIVMGTSVGYCVPQLIAVCVIYTEIKISALFE